MQNPSLNPLNQPAEAETAVLTRLSARIATLTGLLDDAQGRGRIFLAGLFAHTRDAEVARAREEIARARSPLAPRLRDDTTPAGVFQALTCLRSPGFNPGKNPLRERASG